MLLSSAEKAFRSFKVCGVLLINPSGFPYQPLSYTEIDFFVVFSIRNIPLTFIINWIVMSLKSPMHIYGNYSWAVPNPLSEIEYSSTVGVKFVFLTPLWLMGSINAPLDKIQVGVYSYICMPFGACFSIFSLRFCEIRLEQSLWHFRMSLLKACPATRCSYKCTVNPHWIHVSRESFGEMKLCPVSKIIMWYSVPRTVHFPSVLRSEKE